MNTHELNTLEHVIKARKCRKGPSAGMNLVGRFWRPFFPIIIFQSDDTELTFDIQHYENGKMELFLFSRNKHDDYVSYYSRHNLLELTSVKELIYALQNDEHEGKNFLHFPDRLIFLAEWGLTLEHPGPDEV